MNQLSPNIAAKIAQEIYAVQQESTFKFFLARAEFSQTKGSTQQLNATVGSRLFNTRDGFGVCAMGGAGYENELFMIFRGSTSANNNADWISNARIGVNTSKTGLPVHLGFNHIFSSMLPQIQQFLRGVKQIKAVHCIGHSLGGAIATLTADWIKSNKGVPVKLYTFGAPKPGMMLFASRFSQKLGKQNIFRVYHATDPVPMIPLYPFVHPPLPGFGHYVPSSQGIFSSQAHDINEYIKSVKNASWSSLERRNPPYNMESAIEMWLESASPVTSASPHIWQWINAALIYVLKKITATAALLLQSGFIGAITLADTLAYILKKGIDISQAIGNWVLLLIKKIMQALGMAVIKTVDTINQVFLSHILVRLMDKTNEEAKRAIRKMN